MIIIEEFNEEDREDIDSLMNDLYMNEEKYYAEVKRWNNRIFKAIEMFRGKEYIDELEVFVGESGGGFSKFEFVRKPFGNCQKEDNFQILKYVWVNQYRNGGFTGDDFAGEIYVKLKRGLFFKFTYDC